jgi:hypothetical protein
MDHFSNEFGSPQYLKTIKLDYFITRKFVSFELS